MNKEYVYYIPAWDDIVVKAKESSYFCGASDDNGFWVYGPVMILEIDMVLLGEL